MPTKVISKLTMTLRIARRTADNRVLIFRPKENASRMAYSAEAVSMPPVPESLFLQAVHMAVAKNAKFIPPHDFHGSLYIRPLQFGSSCQIGLEPPDEYIFCVFVQPHIAFHGHGVALKALVAEDFDRAATRGTGHVKVGGNYAPVIKWSREAKREENGGWNVLLHVDSKTQTYVDEFSTSGFIGIVGTLAPQEANDDPGLAEEETVAPKVVLADSPACIKSITSDCVEALAISLGWSVERRQVKLDELGDFSEVMAAGTAAGLVPIKCIYHKSSDKLYEFSGNEVRDFLWERLLKIQRGEEPDAFGWCEELRWDEFRDA